MVTVTNDDTRDKGTVGVNWAITNWVQDSTLDCNEAFAEAGFLALQDIVATLVADLIRQGILKGSVATA
jgi:hypothetical protein